jgi:hypothetical protein
MNQSRTQARNAVPRMFLAAQLHCAMIARHHWGRRLATIARQAGLPPWAQPARQ